MGTLPCFSVFLDEQPSAADATIGNLGLSLNHRFLYLFDYGDCHESEVQVAEIRPRAGRGKYLRVVERRGRAPEQYPLWD